MAPKLIFAWTRPDSDFMPRKETSEDVLTRDTWLIYHLWKEGGFSGSISELSDKLGYADDSAINKRVNSLKLQGYLEEEVRGSRSFIKPTGRGLRRIAFLILPKYTLLVIAASNFGYLWWGINAMLSISPVLPQLLVVNGAISLACLAILWWVLRIGEKELYRMGKLSQ